MSYQRFVEHISHNCFILCRIDRECGAICGLELTDRTEGMVKGDEIKPRRNPMRYAVLVLMVVLFIPACAAPVAASTNEAMTPPIAAQFDTNDNNMIEKNEAIDAIIAYFNGEITKGQAIDIIILYFSGGTIQEQVAPNLAEVAAQVMPAVVKILNDEALAQGSGAIYKVDGENGYVITNQHVVRGADIVTVTVNNATDYQGTVLGVDAARDLAVVRICCNAEFPSVDFGDSEQLQIGDEVLAVGYPVDDLIPKDGETGQPKVIVNPGEVSATVTRGIVSAVRYDSENDVELVQTDAPLNPGNSGGPLFAMDGTIIGIVTFAVPDTEGLNFAVLETTVQEQLPTLVAGGERPDTDAMPAFSFNRVFAPSAGHIHHNDDPYFGGVTKWDLEAWLAPDIIVEGIFYNPYAGSTHPFSYGIGIRTEPSLLFVVDSRGTWQIRTLYEVDDKVIARGQAPGMRTGANEANFLDIAAVGSYVWFVLNGDALTDANGQDIFHLGPSAGYGGPVSIVNGYFTGTERAGSITHFENFLAEEVVYTYLSSEETAREALTQKMAGEVSQEALQRELQSAELE